VNSPPQEIGAWPALQDKFIAITPGRWNSVKLVVHDRNFKVYLGNSPFMDANDDIIKRSDSGRLGFQGSPKSMIWFDDVQVWGTT